MAHTQGHFLHKRLTRMDEEIAARDNPPNVTCLLYVHKSNNFLSSGMFVPKKNQLTKLNFNKEIELEGWLAGCVSVCMDV